jgi:hypothetical protein
VSYTDLWQLLLSAWKIAVALLAVLVSRALVAWLVAWLVALLVALLGSRLLVVAGELCSLHVVYVAESSLLPSLFAVSTVCVLVAVSPPRGELALIAESCVLALIAESCVLALIAESCVLALIAESCVLAVKAESPPVAESCVFAESPSLATFAVITERCLLAVIADSRCTCPGLLPEPKTLISPERPTDVVPMMITPLVLPSSCCACAVLYTSAQECSGGVLLCAGADACCAACAWTVLLDCAIAAPVSCCAAPGALLGPPGAAAAAALASCGRVVDVIMAVLASDVEVRGAEGLRGGGENVVSTGPGTPGTCTSAGVLHNAGMGACDQCIGISADVILYRFNIRLNPEACECDAMPLTGSCLTSHARSDMTMTAGVSTGCEGQGMEHAVTFIFALHDM